MQAEREAKPDPLEPPGVRVRPVLIAAAGCLATIAVGMTGLHFLYQAQAHGGEVAKARPFPAPALQTSLRPNRFRAPGVRAVQDPTAATVGVLHFRERPPSDEAALARAMQAIAARGDRAYDPAEGDRGAEAGSRP